jgi:hypothetical protein
MDRIVKGALMALVVGIFFGTSAGANTLYFQLEPISIGGSPKLFIFGNPACTGVVKNSSGFSQTFTLDADGYAVVDLPVDDVLNPGLGAAVENKGFSISSREVLKAYVLNRGGVGADMTSLIDADNLGTDYVIAAYNNTRFDLYQTYDDQLSIQATRDDTTVTILPKGFPPRTTNLNAGQTYITTINTDNSPFIGGFTGWLVSADKPIVVQSGTQFADIPNHPVFSINGAGHVAEQLPSIDRLSTSYVLPQLPRTGFGGNVVRVVATADDTAVQVNGVTLATLDKGDYYEGRVAGGEQINATHPVLVAEYMLSNEYLADQDYLPAGSAMQQTDAAMTIVPGTDQWLKSYVFARLSTAPDLRTDYAAIVIKTDSLPSLRVAGAAVDPAEFTPIGSTGYSYGNIDVSNVTGVYRVAADTPFELLLAGLADQNTYLTYGGATFSPGVPLPPPLPPSPVNTPPSAHGDAAAAADTLYVQIDPQLDSGLHQLMIFGPPAAAGTVSGSSGFSQTFRLDAEGYTAVDLPAANTLGDERVENKGFWITSGVPLSAYYLSRGAGGSAMTALIKGASLGRQYLVAGYHYDFQNDEDWTRFDDQISVQATQNNTTVTIAPGREPSFKVALHAGQTYRYAADHDISGSSVTADKAIVVQSGNVCAAVPNPPGTDCGLLLAQLPAVDNATSMHFLLPPTQAIPAGTVPPFDLNVVRVLATQDDTEVAFNGGTVTHLSKGGYTEQRWTGGLQIDADHPVLVVDYLDSQDWLRIGLGAAGAGVNSSPAMTTVPGVDQWQKRYVFATPSGAADFPADYASLVIQTGSLPSLRVAGTAVNTAGFSPIGSTGYSYGRVDVSDLSGAFTITADTAFGLLFAGFDDHDSYLTYAAASGSASPSPPPSGIPMSSSPATNDGAVEVGNAGTPGFTTTEASGASNLTATTPTSGGGSLYLCDLLLLMGVIAVRRRRA